MHLYHGFVTPSIIPSRSSHDDLVFKQFLSTPPPTPSSQRPPHWRYSSSKSLNPDLSETIGSPTISDTSLQAGVVPTDQLSTTSPPDVESRALITELCRFEKSRFDRRPYIPSLQRAVGNGSALEFVRERARGHKGAEWEAWLATGDADTGSESEMASKIHPMIPGVNPKASKQQLINTSIHQYEASFLRNQAKAKQCANQQLKDAVWRLNLEMSRERRRHWTEVYDLGHWASLWKIERWYLAAVQETRPSDGCDEGFEWLMALWERRSSES